MSQETISTFERTHQRHAQTRSSGFWNNPGTFVLAVLSFLLLLAVSGDMYYQYLTAPTRGLTTGLSDIVVRQSIAMYALNENRDGSADLSALMLPIDAADEVGGLPIATRHTYHIGQLSNTEDITRVLAAVENDALSGGRDCMAGAETCQSGRVKVEDFVVREGLQTLSCRLYFSLAPMIAALGVLAGLFGFISSRPTGAKILFICGLAVLVTMSGLMFNLSTFFDDLVPFVS